jgi:5-methylcytosine-specific restriction endonuclease McrA
MTRKEEKKLIKRIEKEADAIWREKVLDKNLYACEICLSQADQAHHFFPKGQNGHLRYDIDNGIPICRSCHFKHHSTYNPTIHGTIIKKRGTKWYKNLEEKSKAKPSSFKNLKWYQEQLEIVKKYGTNT